ncbi:hypothetical protein AVEN_7934-1 [Araneus ventricosus]|uniref:Uncharacterized protein n=1 Tax=Araneus ventricosus TaxID=182803 RepID=A0A4Y2D1V6_ARAVE|nr:hypothetical protein AVEN_7934-1 [Araneus ventricosus]
MKYQSKFEIQTLRNEINCKNRIAIVLSLVPATTGGMGPELAHKTLESQFRFSLLTANDVFFTIEVLWVQTVISVNSHYPHSHRTSSAYHKTTVQDASCPVQLRTEGGFSL